MESEDDVPPTIHSLVDLVRFRSGQGGLDPAMTFLPDGQVASRQLTYGELDHLARARAAWLQSSGFTGTRVLLLYPSGLEFVISFLGCLYAGSVPVPTPPPRPGTSSARLRRLVDDSAPALALTEEALRSPMLTALAEAGIERLRLETSELLDGTSPAQWSRPDIDGESLAFLQYTSGSTSDPRGVMVTHGNLLANHRMMRRAFGQTRNSRIVSWLPLFHDMGLIGNVLQALYLGTECLLMPPEAFLTKPARWLSIISRYRARFSGCPNFAYELCVQKVTQEQRESLDLRSWETAYVGAEPIRHSTMDRFAAAFEPCGFRPEALYPCYGLAEATLFVSGGGRLTGVTRTAFDPGALEQHRAVPATETAGIPGRILVGCGHTWSAQRIAIVDPATCRPVTADEIGEIWIAGSSVSPGYWGREKSIPSTFDTRIDGEDSAYLRTGDLGFFHEGELYIAGRLKDLIIIAGRKHDPSDLELTTEASHPDLRRGRCAAFQIEVEGEPRLVIAAELTPLPADPPGGADSRDRSPFAGRSIVRAIRAEIVRHHDLAPCSIVLLAANSLPLTSSGKVRRSACRSAFLDGTLPTWDLND